MTMAVCVAPSDFSYSYRGMEYLTTELVSTLVQLDTMDKEGRTSTAASSAALGIASTVSAGISAPSASLAFSCIKASV
ncbi:hypothetical protein LDENG_00241210 [Lucifuga dentata]|nr:hypothetical protein LDENG_00241210 [Lucifuga dentata]